MRSPRRWAPAGWERCTAGAQRRGDRKSTRLNSSHDQISYAVFCLKKKKKNERTEENMTEIQTRQDKVSRLLLRTKKKTESTTLSSVDVTTSMKYIPEIRSTSYYTRCTR